jgi:hypothetical protein
MEMTVTNHIKMLEIYSLLEYKWIANFSLSAEAFRLNWWCMQLNMVLKPAVLILNPGRHN